jgi:hypothetical protein
MGRYKRKIQHSDLYKKLYQTKGERAASGKSAFVVGGTGSHLRAKPKPSGGDPAEDGVLDLDGILENPRGGVMSDSSNQGRFGLGKIT